MKNQFHQLRVNLRSEEATKEAVSASQLEKFYGGVGYSASLLNDELDPNVDPLGPENKIILATGPLTHKMVPGGGSVELCFKSPLTNGWEIGRAHV